MKEITEIPCALCPVPHSGNIWQNYCRSHQNSDADTIKIQTIPFNASVFPSMKRGREVIKRCEDGSAAEQHLALARVHLLPCQRDHWAFHTHS